MVGVRESAKTPVHCLIVLFWGLDGEGFGGEGLGEGGGRRVKGVGIRMGNRE